MDHPDLRRCRVQHDSVIFLQRFQRRDHCVARLSEMRSELIDGRGMLAIDEMPENRVMQGGVVELHGWNRCTKAPRRDSHSSSAISVPPGSRISISAYGPMLRASARPRLIQSPAIAITAFISQ